MSENGFHITQTQVVFEYQQNLTVRKRVFEYEDKLNEFFKTPFNIINVPDTFNPEFPRFEANSHYGHSKIQVSQMRLNLTTVYNEEFKSNLREIKEYILNRVNILKELVEKEKIQFLAYIIEMGYPMEKGRINDFIKKVTNIDAVHQNTVDFTLAYSYPLNERFYLNVKCSKYILQHLKMDLQSTSIESTGDPLFGISVTLDINSKYYLDRGMKFEDSLFNEIEETIFNIISKNKLENFLKGEIIK